MGKTAGVTASGQGHVTVDPGWKGMMTEDDGRLKEDQDKNDDENYMINKVICFLSMLFVSMLSSKIIRCRKDFSLPQGVKRYQYHHLLHAKCICIILLI